MLPEPLNLTACKLCTGISVSNHQRNMGRWQMDLRAMLWSFASQGCHWRAAERHSLDHKPETVSVLRAVSFYSSISTQSVAGAEIVIPAKLNFVLVKSSYNSQEIIFSTRFKRDQSHLAQVVSKLRLQRSKRVELHIVHATEVIQQMQFQHLGTPPLTVHAASYRSASG